MGPYVLDFYRPADRLAVELDGAVHDGLSARAYDSKRTRRLRAVGIREVRFENDAVRQDVDVVLVETAACFGA